LRDIEGNRLIEFIKDALEVAKEYKIEKYD
jgi:hypothetical protein